MLGLFDGFHQRLSIEEYAIADAFQHGRVGTIHACAKHVAAQIFGTFGFDMEVVARFHGFFPARANEYAEMCLVRPFVGRKARVAVETIGAIFQRQALTGLVELLHTGNDLFGYLVEFALRFQIFILMLQKPLTVIVVQYAVEKCKYIFHNENSKI